MPQLTEEQKSYIVEHINDRPRTAVAKTAGVSMTMLYRLVRTHDGEMRHDLSRRNPQHVEIVKKYYPTMTGSEIEAKFGILKGRADKIANELGIKHTPETQERIRKKMEVVRREARANIDYKAAGRRHSVCYKMEYYRKWKASRRKQNYVWPKQATRSIRLNGTLLHVMATLRPPTHILSCTTRTRKE